MDMGREGSWRLKDVVCLVKATPFCKTSSALDSGFGILRAGCSLMEHLTPYSDRGALGQFNAQAKRLVSAPPHGHSCCEFFMRVCSRLR